MIQPTDKDFRPDLIVDVGMHEGLDTEFYLKKGFRVAAVEADPDLAQTTGERLANFVKSGQLHIHNVAVHSEEGTVSFFQNKELSVWGTLDPSFADRNTRLGKPSTRIEVRARRFENILKETGIPYYLKIDIEGFDNLCLQALEQFSARPRFISVEAGLEEFDEAFDQLTLLWRLGYRKIKIVNQIILHRITLPNPPREGSYVDTRFHGETSGPFGEETQGPWLTFDQALARIPKIISQQSWWGDHGRFGRSPLRRLHRIGCRLLGQEPPGWYDFHVKMD